MLHVCEMYGLPDLLFDKCEKSNVTSKKTEGVLDCNWFVPFLSYCTCTIFLKLNILRVSYARNLLPIKFDAIL